MAVWQFHIYFIPRQSLLGRYGYIPAALEMNEEGWADYYEAFNFDVEPDFEDALTVLWWLNLDLHINQLLPVLQQFGELQEWTAQTKGLRSFGNTETNDISVSFDHTTRKVQDLSCRLDLRQIDKVFVSKLLSLAMRFNCLLMDRHGILYEPAMKNLVEKMERSDASQFVQDPEQYLNDLSNGISKPE